MDVSISSHTEYFILGCDIRSGTSVKSAYETCDVGGHSASCSHPTRPTRPKAEHSTVLIARDDGADIHHEFSGLVRSDITSRESLKSLAIGLANSLLVKTAKTRLSCRRADSDPAL